MLYSLLAYLITTNCAINPLTDIRKVEQPVVLGDNYLSPDNRLYFFQLTFSVILADAIHLYTLDLVSFFRDLAMAATC